MCHSDYRKFHIICLLTVLICSGQAGCGERKDTLFHKLSPSASGIGFINELKHSDTLSVLDFEYMFNGSGVALIDINNDGLQDLFFGGNMVSSRLYVNKGKLQFEDITRQAGVTTEGWVYGISITDINNDGFRDIYLCKAGNRRTSPADMRNIFFINNGNGTFTDRAAEMGLDDDGYDVHAAFLDYDKDGDADMYLLRNAFVNYNRNTARNKKVDGGAPSTDKLFRNNGNMTFTDVSAEAGITVEGFGLGVTVCDLNNDNLPDIYVSNDFLTNDLLWTNNGNGTFTNNAGKFLKHQTYNAMGNDVADYNNDGWEDIIAVDMLPPDNKRWKLTMRGNTYEEFQNALSYGYEPQYVRNTLQLNNGDGSFSEIGQLAGVHATEWSWAPLFADFDNDGFKDLFVSNGYRQDITNLDFIRYGKNALFVGTPEANRSERLKQLSKFPGIRVHSYLFRNNGDLTFADRSESWGMDDPSYSNGAAYGDLDNDGDLDLVINKLDQVSAVYENTCANASWIRFGFRGPEKNREGLGARICLWQHGKMQMNYFSPYRGYLSTVEPFLHFGLTEGKIDSVRIVWPDGKTQLLKNVRPTQLLWVEYKNADGRVQEENPAVKTSLFTVNKNIPAVHEEDVFVDFKNQPLIPKMLSREGPAIAVTDVDHDGLDDFFAGASAGHRGAVFMQQPDGSFHKKEIPVDNTADNMGSIFFDADGDGDDDLYVASGGSLSSSNEKLFIHHLYLNNGNGNFSDAPGSLPGVNSSASSVTACDYDRDGDADLFVAGRLTPGKYPLTPKSYLLRNDSKKSAVKFSDVTASSGEGLMDAGMVTSALWTDFDNDGWSDLLLAGEYMPLRFFRNERGKFIEISSSTGLAHTHGWWNSLVAGDFDKDGDMDYVAGNLGLNSPYKTSPSQPLCVYANDYDKDGRIDPVMCHFVGGKEYIVHSRDDINRQMAPMRARFRTYEAYANVSFRDAFRKDEISAATVLKTETFESSYIENLGKGKFRIKSLPLTAQFSPIYGMLSADVNGDGNPDLVCVGNSYGTEVQTGRYDAQGTLVLTGDGKGNLTPRRELLNLAGDHKSIAMLSGARGNTVMLVGANSDSVRSVSVPVLDKLIQLEAGDIYAMITGADGTRYKVELYRGHSYLSQSSRRLFIPAGTIQAEIFDAAGKQRALNFEKR